MNCDMKPELPTDVSNMDLRIISNMNDVVFVIFRTELAVAVTEDRRYQASLGLFFWIPNCPVRICTIFMWSVHSPVLI